MNIFKKGGFTLHKYNTFEISSTGFERNAIDQKFCTLTIWSNGAFMQMSFTKEETERVIESWIKTLNEHF